jgi:hypothetical protein
MEMSQVHAPAVLTPCWSTLGNGGLWDIQGKGVHMPWVIHNLSV